MASRPISEKRAHYFVKKKKKKKKKNGGGVFLVDRGLSGLLGLVEVREKDRWKRNRKKKWRKFSQSWCLKRNCGVVR
jgi:hypothetical protein